MADFAQVIDGVVVNVIVAEQEFIDTLVDKDTWLKTDIETFGNKHLNNGTPFRKNYAGIGYTYDEQRDAFIPPKPFNSWILNEDTCLWEAPVPMPDESYIWNEDNQSWEEVVNDNN